MIFIGLYLSPKNTTEAPRYPRICRLFRSGQIAGISLNRFRAGSHVSDTYRNLGLGRTLIARDLTVDLDCLFEGGGADLLIQVQGHEFVL